MSGIHLGTAWIAWALAAATAFAEPCAPAFEQLRFESRKALILSGEVEIQARVPSAGERAEALRDCPEGGCLAPGDCVVLLDATTKAPMHLSQELTWMEPGGQGVLQVLSARRGKRWKLVRLTRDGHHRWARRPESRREAKHAVDDWSGRSDEHVAWGDGPIEGARSSSFALLHQAMAGRLDREGASAAFLVHSKGRLLRVELRAQELVEVDADYTLNGSRVEGPQQLRRVTVTGDDLDAEEDESPVGLLGMSSGIELFLAPGSGLPVEVRGKVSGLGELRVRLAEAVLPELSAPASR